MRPNRTRSGAALAALWTLGAPLLLAGCNDTRDLAPPDPATPWYPTVRTRSDDAPPTAVPATGERAAGARSTLPPNDRAATYVLPFDGALPAPDPHPAIDPTHTYSLVELIDIAERNNKETRIAWEQARQAAIEVGLSRAAYLPALTLSALGGFRHETTPAEVPKGYVTSDTVAAFPTLTINYLLLDFGARDAALRASRDLSEAADVAFTGVHQQLILSVTRAFLTLATADAELDAANTGLRNAELLRTAASARLAHGEGTVTDKYDAESGVAQARFTVATATASRQEARDNLLEVLGLPPRAPLRVASLGSEPVPRDMLGNLDALMRTALRSRPDLLAALARLRAAEATTAHARAALYPTVSLAVTTAGDVGRISVEGIASHSFDQPEAGIYLDFHWTIYQGGALRNQVRLAESRQAEQLASLQNDEDGAMQQVALAYDELESGVSQYDAAVAQQQAAAVAFGSNASSFRQGVATTTAAETTASLLAQADATVARAHAQVLASAAALAFASGELRSATDVAP